MMIMVIMMVIIVKKMVRENSDNVDNKERMIHGCAEI